MLYPVAVGFVLMHVMPIVAPLAEGSRADERVPDRDILNDPNCSCYRQIKGFTCHCEGERILLYVTGWHFIGVILVCNGETLSDPYGYLSLLRVDYDYAYYNPSFGDYATVSLNVTGCPPPEQGYSPLYIRAGGSPGERGYTFPISRLQISCGNLEDFALERRLFQDLRNLTTLEIDCRSLTSLPADLYDDVGETANAIGIRNTPLETFPKDLFSRFKRLEFLYLIGNRLNSFGSLDGLQHLKNVNVMNNAIGDLGGETFEVAGDIYNLNIGGNVITTLPDSVCGLRSLEYLYAENNRIEHVKAGCFDLLVALKVVRLHGNRLRSLEPSMTLRSTCPPHLELCHAEDNDSRVSPDPLGTFPSRPGLRKSRPLHVDYQIRLDFSSNEIASVHEGFFSKMVNLTELDLSHNSLPFLPRELFNRNVHLKALRLSNNKISELPVDLLSANALLERIDLSSNRIATLGAAFFEGLVDLKYVGLGNNAIDTLPSHVFLPLNLSSESEDPLELDLGGNRLVTLPSLRIRRLTALNLALNRLERIPPDTLLGVHLLERINLSSNSIRSTDDFRLNQRSSPIAFNLFHSGLVRLRSIDLSNNQLPINPIFYTVQTTLRFLDLRGNRIPLYPLQNLDAEISALEYLDISNNNDRATMEVDVMFLRSLPTMQRVKHLDLSRNKMAFYKCLEGHPLRKYIRCETYLDDLLRLEVLLLAHNELDFIPVYFESLPKLRLVDLSFNRITVVSHDHLFFKSALRKELVARLGEPEGNYVRRRDDYYELPNSHHLTIDLSNNEIEQVELPDHKMETVKGSLRKDRDFSRATMLLGHNPIVCDCQVLKLLRYAQKEMRPVSEQEMWGGGLKYIMPVKVDIKDLSCWQPISMRRKNLSNPETWAHHLLPMFGLCQLVQGTMHP